MRWGEKRFYSLDYYLKETFDEKLYKLSLNGGMTCPNRDGKIDTRGCIFCSRGGSGDFAACAKLSITEQIETGKSQVAAKYKGSSYIAYFQAYTNTYAPASYLRKIFYEAITHPDIRILSIATRPDCLNDEIIDLLTEASRSIVADINARSDIELFTNDSDGKINVFQRHTADVILAEDLFCDRGGSVAVVLVCGVVVAGCIKGAPFSVNTRLIVR